MGSNTDEYRYLTQPRNVHKFLEIFPSVKAQAIRVNDVDSLMLIYDFEYALEQAIPTFSDKQREAFVMIYLEGKSQREAGKEKGISQQAIQSSCSILTKKISNVIRKEYNLPQL